MPTKTTKTTKKPAKKPSRSAKSSAPSQATHIFTWREVALVASLLILTSCIGITLATDIAFDPARDAERALTRLVDDYYTEFLYPLTLNYDFSDPESVLSVYTHPGFAPLRLRQLFLFKNNNAKTIKPFDNTYYRCNRDTSIIRIFPIAPYGPRDYRIEYDLDCTMLPQ